MGCVPRMLLHVVVSPTLLWGLTTIDPSQVVLDKVRHTHSNTVRKYWASSNGLKRTARPTMNAADDVWRRRRTTHGRSHGSALSHITKRGSLATLPGCRWAAVVTTASGREAFGTPVGFRALCAVGGHMCARGLSGAWNMLFPDTAGI